MADSTTGVMFTGVGEAGEEGKQFFQLRRCAFANQDVRLGVSIPGLGHVAIGGQQAVGHHEAGS